MAPHRSSDRSALAWISRLFMRIVEAQTRKSTSRTTRVRRAASRRPVRTFAPMTVQSVQWLKREAEGI